ncbi:bifunctional folylpolyglutamate synthase/dihydrofolate synthase [Clostridia bacterium]|nr:bifunctional folylpolyglutamate synthase/dihydrofolate synthase [Clostridia bacterium]
MKKDLTTAEPAKTPKNGKIVHENGEIEQNNTDFVHENNKTEQNSNGSVHEKDEIEQSDSRSIARQVMRLKKDGGYPKQTDKRTKTAEEYLIERIDLEGILEAYSANGRPVTDLSRFTRLMHVLDNPHRRLKFVHIAGTNGKGSVGEFIAQGLMCGGRYGSVGQFMSPHLCSPAERIQADSRFISDEELRLVVGVALYAVAVHDIGGVSQFELYTAAAMLWFVRRRCGIVVLECGIGGLLDCTNIVTPLVSVITSVGFDHSEILGGTVREIAAQKAGIIKADTPVCIGGDLPPAALEVIRSAAKKKHAKIHCPPAVKILQSSIFGSEFEVGRSRFKLEMGGAHQIRNAACAISALKILGATTAEICEGLSDSMLPARGQIVALNPLTIIDGAHNEDGFAALLETIYTMPMEFIFIVGCTGKHSASKLFKNIRFGDKVILTDGYSDRAVSAGELERECLRCGVNQSFVYTASSTAKALETATNLVIEAREAYSTGSMLFPHISNHPAVHKDAAVVITGSLYLAGDALIAVTDTEEE